MEERRLGRSGLKVSALGYGCMGLSGMYGQPLPRAEGICFAWSLRRATLHE